MNLVFVIVFVFLIHLMSMNFVLDKGKGHYENGCWSGEVYDIIQNNFPDLCQYNYTKNWYLLVFLIPLIFSNNFTNLFSHLSIFIKWFIVIILIRALTIPLTILPKQKNHCSPDQFNLFHGTIGGTCYDKIFSGHFAFGLLFTFWLFKFNYLNTTTFNIILFTIINIIHAFILGITRSHYTIDLAVSAIVVYLVLLHYKEIHTI